MAKILILAGIILSSVSVSAQIISPEIYQTEEDLLEGLQAGELTFDQYLELLDLMRQKAQLAEPDSERTLEIPDWDYSTFDSTNYDSRERISQFLPEREKSSQAIQGKVILQHRQKISQPSEPETYLKIGTGNANFWNFYLESESQDNQNRIKRRGVEFARPGNWKIVLGNFQPRFGLGVNVGYRAYLNFSSENSLEAENTFLFPLWTRYNGIYTNYQRRNVLTSIFYSHNRFGSYKDQAGGAALQKRWRNVAISPIFSYQEISRPDDKFVSRALSLYAKLFLPYSEISAEFALTGKEEKGAVVEAFFWQARKYDLHLSFWSYSQNFLHPLSGGKALPDYRSVELEDLGLAFRSRQAGETGMYFSWAASPNPRTRLELAYQQWKDGNSFLNKNKARIGLGLWLRKNLEVRLKQYWEDDNLRASFPEAKTTSVVATYLFSRDTKLQFRMNWRNSLLAQENNNSTWEEVIFYFPVKERFGSKFRIRYRDVDISSGANSSWNFYLSENVKAAENVILIAEFVSKQYQEMDREDYQVLRIRVEWNL